MFAVRFTADIPSSELRTFKLLGCGIRNDVIPVLTMMSFPGLTGESPLRNGI